MSDRTENRNPDCEAAPRRSRSLPGRILSIIGWTLLGVLILVIGLAVGVSLYFTPERITRLVNRELSGRLNADVTVGRVDYTFLGTFPELNIRIDSLYVKSRALQGLSDSARRRLPADADFLMKSGKVSAGLSVPALLGGNIRLRDVRIHGLSLNLVNVNDSLANYNILPPDLKLPSKMPRISLDTLALTGIGPVKAAFVEKGIDADVRLRHIAVANRDRDDVYDIALEAMADLRCDGRSYLREFPLGLAGKMAVDFNPVRIETDGMRLRAGLLEGQAVMRLAMRERPMLEKLNFRLDTFRLDRLLEQISLREYVDIDGLSAPVELNVEVNLARPYDLTGGKLPTLLARVNVPRGALSYSSQEYGDYYLKKMAMTALLHLDGENPDRTWLDVPSLHLGDREAGLEMQGRVTRLFSDPHIRANVKGRADLATLLSMINGGSVGNIKGNVDMATSVRFNLSDIKRKEFHKIEIGGHVLFDDLWASVPGMLQDLSASRLLLTFAADARELDGTRLSGGLFDFTLNADNLHVAAGGYKVRARDIVAESSLSAKGTRSLASLSGSVPLDLGIKAARLEMDQPDDTIHLHLDDADIRGHLLADMNGNVQPRDVETRIKGTALAYRGKTAEARVGGVDISVKGRRLAAPRRAARFRAPASWHADDASTAFLTTTPRFLTAGLSESTRDMMRRWNAIVRLKAARGDLSGTLWLLGASASGIDVEAALDTVRIRSLNLRSGHSAASVTGIVYNLRQFLGSATPAPLRARLKLAVDTADVNELCAAYRRSVDIAGGPGTFARMLRDTTIHPSDSIAVLIPRNLFAEINAAVRHLPILDVALHGIRGSISTGDGLVRVDTMSLRTAFADAGATISYDTRHLQRMRLGIDAYLARLSLSDLFHSFPLIVEKAPPVKYLSGDLSATASAELALFPRMYLDVPSLHADMNLHGSDIWLRQNRTIRHITRMMLIPQSGPLHFDNINVHAVVKDNLMLLYPFDIDFSNYSVEVLGLSNFGGDIYYHVGLQKTPLPIRFGVNVKGTFRNPVIRFGGRNWRGIRGTEIAAGVMDHSPVNLPSRLRHMTLEFVEKAADYEEQTDSLLMVER